MQNTNKVAVLASAILKIVSTYSHSKGEKCAESLYTDLRWIASWFESLNHTAAPTNTVNEVRLTALSGKHAVYVGKPINNCPMIWVSVENAGGEVFLSYLHGDALISITDEQGLRVVWEDSPWEHQEVDGEDELAGPEYSVGAISANGESFLDIYKEWGEDDYERLVIPQTDWEIARKTAVRANDLLEQGQLESAMQLVENQGVIAGVIDPERDDPRLFTQGPPDPFTTIREEEIDDELTRYSVTWRNSQGLED